MPLSRRTFFKLGGAAALGAVAAPLFIPAERLDFGVPTQKLVVPDPPKIISGPSFVIEYPGVAKIPVMLIEDDYIPEHGGRLKSGSILMVDQATADRWAKHGIAVSASKSFTSDDVIPGRDWGKPPHPHVEAHPQFGTLPPDEAVERMLAKDREWARQAQKPTAYFVTGDTGLKQTTSVYRDMNLNRDGHLHDIIDGKVSKGYTRPMPRLHD